jgi:ABC-2 type transport system permease protein
MSLLALRTRALRNAVRRTPGRYLVGAVFLGLVSWGLLEVSLRGVRFVDGFPAIGSIADAALQRSVEALVTLLMLAVAFSVLTSAITTLYAAEDLPFLLSLPIDAARVFEQKVLETYLSSALLPALFTVPVLVGLGVARSAPASYYPVAVASVLALFALPVAAGALLALLLMRFSPAGRVKEVATALSVVLAAGLVFALRALRPEQLTDLTPEEFEVLLRGFADLGVGWLPPGWAGTSVWAALGGALSPAAVLLVSTAAVSLWGVGRVAAVAYREGWVRGIDTAHARHDPTPRRAAAWEAPLARLGPAGALVVKDVRLLLRDPAQWSQLLVLAALAGVYLVSTASVEVEGQRFRDALGTLNVAFLGFLLAGVGVRLAFPAVSLEGEGWWLVRTAPLATAQVVVGKFLHVLPTMLVLGVGLGVAQALLLDVGRTLATSSIVAGACAGVAISALGVGLGAAFPRFDATNPAEVPMSPGGLLYMTTSLLYAAALTVVLAYPSWRALIEPQAAVWASGAGRLVLLLAVGLTVVVALAALGIGTARLHRLEIGNE